MGPFCKTMVPADAHLIHMVILYYALWQLSILVATVEKENGHFCAFHSVVMWPCLGLCVEAYPKSVFLIQSYQYLVLHMLKGKTEMLEPVCGDHVVLMSVCRCGGRRTLTS